MKKTFLTVILAALCVNSVVFASPELKSTSYNTTEVASALVNDFCMAIIKGDLAAVEKFIELGENVNEQSNGMTPAMYAARYNRVDILKALIVHGANLKAKCIKGHHALKYAELSGANEAAEVIKAHLAKK